MRILGTDNTNNTQNISRNSTDPSNTRGANMGMPSASQGGPSMMDPLSPGFRFPLGNTSMESAMNTGSPPYGMNRPPMFDTNRGLPPFPPGFDATRFMMSQHQRFNMSNAPLHQQQNTQLQQDRERQFVAPESATSSTQHQQNRNMNLNEPHINITDSPSTNEGGSPATHLQHQHHQNDPHIIQPTTMATTSGDNNNHGNGGGVTHSNNSNNPREPDSVNVCDSTTDASGRSTATSFTHHHHPTQNNTPSLEQAMRMHVGVSGHMMNEKERPYACSYCPRRFTQKQAQRVHEMQHTGDKPHECQLCHKRFAQKVRCKGCLHVYIHVNV